MDGWGIEASKKRKREEIKIIMKSKKMEAPYGNLTITKTTHQKYNRFERYLLDTFDTNIEEVKEFELLLVCGFPLTLLTFAFMFNWI